ncbi:MAG: SagB/ThcOx family dehydrogenase [Actinobacteria bacterium]|nr:SagB/ThcOx family dehydrogenase [Actinomycetota bacterium]
MPEGIGDRYHKETKYYPEKMSGRGLDWSSKPSPYKEYPRSRRIELPQLEPSSAMSLDEALRKRTSVRDYSDEPLSLRDLSYLLWASTGIQRVEQGYEFRTAPSAGALYPIDTYVVANRVEGIAAGLYHYAIRAHALEELRLGDLRLESARAALGQSICYDAAAVFVWTAIFYRSKWKYEQRGYRYIYMDAGHIGENLYLSATGLGLGACAVGALFDDELNRLLGVDGEEESAIYMAAVGHPL